MNSNLGISIHSLDLDYVTKNNIKRIKIGHKFNETMKLASLIKLIRKYPIKINYHAPVFYNSDPSSTYYLHSNKKLREATFDLLESNLKMAKSLHSENVVVHFISNKPDNDVSEEEIKDIAKESANRLNILSEKYDIPILLEYAGYNNKFYKIEDWIDVIKNNYNLGICLDLGHLCIASKLYDFDYMEELKNLSSYTKLVHIWNTKGTSDLGEYNHIPVHPEQSEDDGWIDIETSLRILLKDNYDLPIIAESDYRFSDLEYFEEGMKWVNKLIYQILNENNAELLGKTV